jgi:hypothetical protein
MENGTVFRVQRYICRDCRYSFVARPPNCIYGKHYPDDIRVKTSLGQASRLFRIPGNVIISHETIRRYVPPPPDMVMDSSGYFVYDGQYTHIDGVEEYRALLKDSKTGDFVEEILDDLTEVTLVNFFIGALSRFSIPDHVCITTDGYHHESVLGIVSERMDIRIRRQRCLFHIEKDLAHRIHWARLDRDLDQAKKMIEYMFFQTAANLKKLGGNEPAVSRHVEGRTDREVVEIMLHPIGNLYADDTIIRNFLSFLRKYRKEVFLYLQDQDVEKTSDKAEQHFSIMS